MKEIYLIRHGRSEANEKHICGGDYPLSEYGKEQVTEARLSFASHNFDKVYSSKLIRACQTATKLMMAPVTEDMQLKEFNEIFFGNAENRISENGFISGFKNQYMENFVGFMKECGGDDPYERADAALVKMRYMASEMIENPTEYPSGRIMIVTSDTLMRCIVQSLVCGHNWSRLSDVKSIDNLEGLIFTYARDSMGYDLLIKVTHFPEEGTKEIWSRKWKNQWIS
ncbi:MAG: histidine phosphatase family protein [Lachnospiraceae bacterium]|nr:histidine phosphatase family protein [Lachnospiraceae bacterium]